MTQYANEADFKSEILQTLVTNKNTVGSIRRNDHVALLDRLSETVDYVSADIEAKLAAASKHVLTEEEYTSLASFNPVLYQAVDQKDQPNGYPGLDSEGSLVGPVVLRNGTAAELGSTVFLEGEGVVIDGIFLVGDGINNGNALIRYLKNSDVGTTANKLVRLDGNAKLPAVDGSQLTNLPSVSAGLLESTKVYTPVTAQTINLSQYNNFVLDFVSASIEVAITITATGLSTTVSANGNLLIYQRAIGPTDINFVIGSGITTIKWLGSEPFWGTDIPRGYRVISYFTAGTTLFMSATSESA